MGNVNVESHRNLVRNKGFINAFYIGALCPACSVSSYELLTFDSAIPILLYSKFWPDLIVQNIVS